MLSAKTAVLIEKGKTERQDKMKKIVDLIILTCILMVISHRSFGQETIKCNQEIFIDTLLDKLTGHWIVTGNVGSDKVVYNFSVQWVLNHQFLEITFSDTATKPEYTAKVFIGYNCQKNKYIIHWIDNFGGAFSETLGFGTKKDKSIEMLFDYPPGQLINTFSYEKKNDQWTSHSITKDKRGNWITFGHIVLKRDDKKEKTTNR